MPKMSRSYRAKVKEGAKAVGGLMKAKYDEWASGMLNKTVKKRNKYGSRGTYRK